MSNNDVILKAKDLVNRFFIEVDSYYVADIVSQPKAKQCALVCVDEMIKEHIHVSQKYKWQDEIWEWLREVKQEIEKVSHQKKYK